MKKDFIFIVPLLLLFSCANNDISKTPQYKSHLDFCDTHKKVVISKTDHKIFIADSGNFNILKYYGLTYSEHYVVKNNLLEVTGSNTIESDKQLHYIDLKGYFQKLYLIKIDKTDSGKNPYFLYYSVKYNPNEEPISIGPTYLGRMDQLHYDGNKSMYRIIFKEEMKFKKEKANKHPAEYQLKAVTSPMIFYADSADYNDHSILVNTIILHGANKIGGTKHLVYSVEETFGSKEALKFINQ